jgi:hypothetical protein
MKKIFGALLLASPFCAIFTAQVIEQGIASTLATWVAALSACAFVIIGVYLVCDD